MTEQNYDVIPVRLPSGTKTFVNLPRPFSVADIEHLIKFLAAYIEELPQPSGNRK